ncbi:unnamed protein product [Ectocarpus sp. 6 AP-2014]
MTIRVDHASNRASVTDVARLLLKCDAEAADSAVGKLHHDFPSVRVNNRGRLALVAPVDKLVDVVWLLPGAVADDVRRDISLQVVRALGGNTRLVEEAEARHIAVREARLSANAASEEDSVGVDDMPPAAKYLCDDDRQQVAKKVVEQSLKRKRIEIEEREIEITRKRCANVMTCYTWMSDLGYEFNSSTVFHILDTMAALTRVNGA